MKIDTKRHEVVLTERRDQLTFQQLVNKLPAAAYTCDTEGLISFYNEQQLRRNERVLADFFENASVGLHWVGPDGIILRANQAELDMLGYTDEEYVGQHIERCLGVGCDDYLTKPIDRKELLNIVARHVRLRKSS